MAIDMKTRRTLIREKASQYRKASKGNRGRILDDLQSWIPSDRKALARALRDAGTSRDWGGARSGGGRNPLYGDEVIDPLKRVWAILSFPCGKRLEAQMHEMLEALARHHELRVAPPTREKLVSMSASTIDRLLAPERKRLELTGRSRTKPGTLLRSQIPIRTFADWDDLRPGFTEVDLVSHEGGNGRGEFCYTLTMTDVATGWTECRAVRNRAERWTFEALKGLRKRLPFPLLGLDSDNGSEFMNHHLFRYCEQERITFTRSRPYRKNDNCFVEQKNYTAVRQMVGYFRYDTAAQRALMNRIYDLHRLYFNYFLPQMKLVAKVRIGSRVTRRYDKPKTPYQRVLESKTVEESVKQRLREEYPTLNPAALIRELNTLQDELWRLTAAQEARRKQDDSGAL